MMPSGQNEMDNKSDGHFLIKKAMIDDYSQAYDNNMKAYKSKLDKLMAMIKNMVV